MAKNNLSKSIKKPKEIYEEITQRIGNGKYLYAKTTSSEHAQASQIVSTIINCVCLIGWTNGSVVIFYHRKEILKTLMCENYDKKLIQIPSWDDRTAQIYNTTIVLS